MYRSHESLLYKYTFQTIFILKLIIENFDLFQILISILFIFLFYLYFYSLQIHFIFDSVYTNNCTYSFFYFIFIIVSHINHNHHNLIFYFVLYQLKKSILNCLNDQQFLNYEPISSIYLE